MWKLNSKTLQGAWQLNFKTLQRLWQPNLNTLQEHDNWISKFSEIYLNFFLFIWFYLRYKKNRSCQYKNDYSTWIWISNQGHWILSSLINTDRVINYVICVTVTLFVMITFHDNLIEISIVDKSSIWCSIYKINRKIIQISLF